MPKNRAQLRRKVTSDARLPPLPKDYFRVISRPRDSLNVSKINPAKIQYAFRVAAKLGPEASSEDTVLVNSAQNIVIIGTPSEARAKAYSLVRSLHIDEKDFETQSYQAAPDGTSKGVIRGFTDATEEWMRQAVLTRRNPQALAIKRIGNSNAFTILFEGLRVPRHVYVEAALVPCSLYRKQIDVCLACGRVGHRRDVCPTPDDVLCRGCGKRNPPQDHTCTPVCKLCGGAHPVGDRKCKNRYQIPYLVRKRRQEKATEEKKKQAALQNPESWPEITQTRGRSTSRGRARTRSTSRRRQSSSRSSSTSRPRDNVSWADTVKVREGNSREQPKQTDKIAKLVAENQRLRKEQQTLREENQKLRKETLDLGARFSRLEILMQTIGQSPNFFPKDNQEQRETPMDMSGPSRKREREGREENSPAAKKNAQEPDVSITERLAKMEAKLACFAQVEARFARMETVLLQVAARAGIDCLPSIDEVSHSSLTATSPSPTGGNEDSAEAEVDTSQERFAELRKKASYQTRHGTAATRK